MWLTSSSANIGRWANIRRAPAVHQPPTRSSSVPPVQSVGPCRKGAAQIGGKPSKVGPRTALRATVPSLIGAAAALQCCASVCDGPQRTRMTRRGGRPHLRGTRPHLRRDSPTSAWDSPASAPELAHICVGLARIFAGTRSHLRRNSAALPQQCAALSRAPRPCVSPARARGPPARPTVPHVDSRDEPLEFVKSYFNHSLPQSLV